MQRPLNAISSLRPPRMDWTIKVRVVKLWNNVSEVIPGRINSTEMVLLDEDGNRIQATVSPRCVIQFKDVLHENGVYVIHYFHLFPNTGLCMLTRHAYRIAVHTKTKFYVDDSYVIHRYGLAVSTAMEIRRRVFGNRHLVDVMGLLTGLYYDYVVDSAGNLATVVRLELADLSGRIECALTGSYVAMFKDLLKDCGEGLPVVVVQFVQSGREEGIVLVKSLEKVTRLLFEPAIPDILRFKQRFLLSVRRGHFGNVYGASSVIAPCPTQFNLILPRKSVSELVDTVEDGLFVIYAKIVSCYQFHRIWYPMCDCGKLMSVSDGLYLCAPCNRTTFNVSVRLSIVVDDGNGTARFQLYDYVLDGIPSLHFKTMGLRYVMSEGGMAEMKDKYFLFIVKKIPRSECSGRERFEVVRVTNNEETIRSYHAIGNNYTPLKCIFKPPFVRLAPSVGDGGSVSTALSLAGGCDAVNHSDGASSSRGHLSGVRRNDDMPMDLGDPALALSLGSLFQKSVDKAK